MTRPEHVKSYYAATAKPAYHHPQLRGEVLCDVCVVGAGFTGLSAALSLAERGYRVVVLEGALVGWGASGRSGGQMLSGYAPGMAKMVKMLGPEQTRRLWDLSEEAKSRVRQRIEQLEIACDLKAGGLLAAAKSSHVAELREEQDVVSETLGYDGMRLVTRDEVFALVASERFHGGLLDHGAGHLHPLNYALGLGDAATKAGVEIFENSRVEKLEAGDRPSAHTAEGVVRAQYMVIAENSYVGQEAPSVRRMVMPVGTYIVATEPLGRERALALIPDDICVCDTKFVLDYFRLSADWRMLFGGRVSYSGQEPRDLSRVMHREMVKTFPQLLDASIDFAWGGHVAITQNRLPSFGRTGTRTFHAVGFSGQGVALTTLAGELMAEAIAGQAERFDVFTRIRHRPFPGGASLRAPLLVLASAYYRLRDLL